MKFRKLLAAAMFAAGTGCLAGAAVWGYGSAWRAAAMCFCTAGVCLSQRRKPSEEG